MDLQNGSSASEQCRQRASVNEVHIVLLEPKSTVNTGQVQSDRTVEPEWI